MSTSVSLVIDQRRPKKDGTYPIVLRLGHNRRTTSIPTGISLKEKDWNEKERKVKPSYVGASSVNRLNNELQKQKAEALDIILKLQEADQLQSLSATELRAMLVRKQSSPSFFAFASEQIEDLKKAKRFGTALWYKGSCAVLKTFAKEKDLTFREITYTLLTQFETDHLSRNNSYNSLSVYMRAIRAIYKKAIAAGLVEDEFYPFKDYKIKTEPTSKRALPWEYLEKIIQAEVSPKDAAFRARHYFLTCYMTYGMNFIDIAYLEKTHIVDGRIHYRRSKTSRLFDIKVLPDLNEILAYYITQNPDSKYVFPILKSEEPDKQYREMYEARRRYNKSLKKLAKLCDIPTNLTSYVGRHSFASRLRRMQVPVDVISSMMGHGSIKTTQIYLDSLPSEELDEYNSKILTGAEKPKKAPRKKAPRKKAG